jgi:hypothetical protein
LIRSSKLVRVLALLALTAAVAPGARAGSANSSRAFTGLPIAQQGAKWGNVFDGTLPLPPEGQTPVQRKDWILNELETNGRTPSEWLRWSEATFNLAMPKDVTAARDADILGSVLSLYANVGLAASVTDVAELQRSIAAIPSEIRPAFGELVQTVATQYALQLPISRTIVARMQAEDFGPTNPLMRQIERDITAQHEATVVDAVNLFRARTAAYFEDLAGSKTESSDPLFADPNGLVILGNVTDDTYNRNANPLLPDPILLVDPAGSDRYNTSAGGACPVTTPVLPNPLYGPWMECNSLVLAVTADLGDGVVNASNDVYHYDGPPSAVQGAGSEGALGILLDVGGNDTYYAKMTRRETNPFSPLFFISYYFDGGAQGFGYAGNGLLLDGVGDDTYQLDVFSTHGNSIWGFAQGFGGAGGLGINSDAAGTDKWLSNGLGLEGEGFEGIYTQGSGFYGGVGIMTDNGLADDYYSAVLHGQTTDFYALGFGAFGGAGIMADDGGDNYYYSLSHATNSWIDPLLNCAYGTASFFGVGIMLSGAGNDTYIGETIGENSGAEVMDEGFGGPGLAYGLFWDLGGDDSYTMNAVAPAGFDEIYTGRGVYGGFDPFDPSIPQNTFGTFVDSGGTDTYDRGLGQDNGFWAFGVDQG